MENIRKFRNERLGDKNKHKKPKHFDPRRPEERGKGKDYFILYIKYLFHRNNF